MKWIAGEPPRDAKGMEKGVAKAREDMAARPDDYHAKCRLREAESAAAQFKSPGWDYVFLLFFTQDYAAGDEEIGGVVKGFVDAARKAGAKPVVWLPWGGTEDVKRYLPLARDLKISIVPVSFAEQLARSGKLAEKTQVKWGGGHPDAKTAYLYACTFYGALTGKSPEGIKLRTIYGADRQTKGDVVLTDEEALKLQRAAWRALEEYRKLEQGAAQ